jgi:hypothetical protein
LYCESWMRVKNRFFRCLNKEFPTATRYLRIMGKGHH